MNDHYWSPERIKEWVVGFYDAHGHLPQKRDMETGGIKKHHRALYGGVTGVLMIAGITAATISIQRKSRDKERLKWLKDHNPQLDDEPEKTLPHTITTPTIPRSPHQRYSPSECVRYGRFALHKRNNSLFLNAIDKLSRSTQAPGIADYVQHFDSIDDLVRKRIRYESWHKMSLEDRQKLVLGYTCLALARVDGDLSYLRSEMDTMHAQQMGPSYEQAMRYTQNKNLREAPFMPVMAKNIVDSYQENPAALHTNDDLDPIFIPELIEALDPSAGFDEIGSCRVS